MCLILNAMAAERSREVWDPQPDEGETEAPGRAFLAFRDMAKPRSLVGLAKQLGYQPQTLHQWSHEFCWRERVDAYDTHLDQVAQKATESEVQRMARERLEVSRLAITVARKTLLQIGKDLDSGHAAVTAQAAARLLDAGAKLQRLELGEVTERTEAVPDYSKLPKEVLEQMAEVNRKVQEAGRKS